MLFVIVFLCLLLLQISFWLVNTGYVETNGAKSSITAVAAKDTQETDDTAKAVVAEPNKIQEAAKQVVAEPNQPAKAAPQQQAGPRFSIKFYRLAWLIRFFNFVLIPAAALYCLTMLFSLKVSLLGRLGGINHAARAFFLSLGFFVLLLPWQRFFPGVVVGAIYTPQELLTWCAFETGGIFDAALFYLRFTGYWLVVMLLLIFSQLRSTRWARAILRRLEVI